MGQNDEFTGGIRKAGVDVAIEQTGLGELSRLRPKHIDPSAAPNRPTPAALPTPSLWFKTGGPMTLDPLHTLARFKAVIAARMQSVGFTGIVVDDLQVAGEKEGGWTALVPILRNDFGDGRQEYAFVAMCASNNPDVARGNAGDIYSMISWEDDLW